MAVFLEDVSVVELLVLLFYLFVLAFGPFDYLFVLVYFFLEVVLITLFALCYFDYVLLFHYQPYFSLHLTNKVIFFVSFALNACLVMFCLWLCFEYGQFRATFDLFGQSTRRYPFNFGQSKFLALNLIIFIVCMLKFLMFVHNFQLYLSLNK